MLNSLKKKLISFFLRIGVAFNFLYVGIASFLNPNSWVGFIPEFFESFISRSSFLLIHSLFAIFLGIWLITNWKLSLSSIISVLFLSAVIIFNLGAFEIVFRDVGILSAAISLVILSRK